MAPTPFHVAIIMDGNGRWATARGMARLQGHSRGVERVRDIIEAAINEGISHLTLFAFSTENWQRSDVEVSGLMSLMRRYLLSESAQLHDNKIKVQFIGRRDRLQPELVDLFDSVEQQTASNDRLVLTLAVDYGGRDEITRMAKTIANKVVKGEFAVEEITETLISAHLDTASLPDPDLIIRTSGEFRVSNFLPWQSAYAEYLFDHTPWPEFDAQALNAALEQFKQRDRRFGKVTQL